MRKPIFRFCLMAVLGMLSTAAWSAPNLVHQPPLEAQAGRPVEVNALVTDPASQVQQVRLFFRAGGSLGYQVQVMNGAGYNFSAQIPGNAVSAAGVDYYLEARNAAGEVATAPPLNASLAPYHLVAREAHAAPQLRLLTPENGATLLPEEAVVAVALESDGSRVDLRTLSVVVDERDVTSRCKISETLLTYVLPESSSDGLHGVRVSVKNMDGVEGKSPTWSFTLKRSASPAGAPASKITESKPETAGRLSGGLGIDAQYAGLTRDSSSAAYFYQPKGWLNRASLSLSGQYSGVNLLTSAYLTSEETPGRQPVDRFRLELYNDAFNATLGDMYPVFSEYSLNNLFVRGASLTLSSGLPGAAYSKFQVVGGQSRLAIEGRDADSPGTFEQWLWAARWMYHFLPGTGFALNYATVNDYANSIQNPGGTLPADNHVATGELNIKIPWTERLYTTLFGEGGVSYYDATQNLFTLSIGSAYRGGMRWDWGGRSYLQVQYKSTGANFVSLANPWLTGDWQGVAGDAQVYLLDDTLALMLSGNSWHDNLNAQKTLTYFSEAAGTTITAGTTTTHYLTGMLNYRLSTYVPSLSLGYSLNRQQDDTRPVSVVDNATGVLNAGLGLQIPLGADPWLTNFNYSETRYSDLAHQRLSADMISSSFMVSTMYLLGARWSFSGGYGVTNNQVLTSGLTPVSGSLPATVQVTRDQVLQYTLASLKANWKAVPGVFDLGAGWDGLFGKDNLNLVENRLTTLSLQGTWYLTASQNLGLKLSQADYSDQIAASGSYTELIANMHYGITF